MKPNEILPFYKTNHSKVWVIGSRAQRVTLYSQQVRALNLVYALASTSRIKQGDHIVIIGGGAAGMTAAIAAAYHVGCKVTLLEMESDLMPLQRGSTKRWLHPHIWDWPSNDAIAEDAGLPILNWTAGSADAVASEICGQFETMNRIESKIDIRLSAKDVAITNPNNINWTDSREGYSYVTDAEAVLIAVGFGIEPQEKNFLSEAVPANSYWALDAIEQNFSRRPLHYMVSGTGDGGLIDVLRLRLKTFRHQDLVSTFLEKDEDGIVEKLRKIETAARDIDKKKQSEFLHKNYGSLTTPRLDELLATRQREDTKVVLHGTGPHWMSLKASVLNRILVSRLLAKPGFHSLTYRHGKLNLNRAGTKYAITIGRDKSQSHFDAIIFRHGPDSDAAAFLSDEELSYLDTLSNVDCTHQPLYGDYFGRVTASPTRGDRHVLSFHALVQGLRKAGLSWPVINDAIMLPIRQVDQVLREVNVGPYPYDRLLDSLTKDDAYTEEVHEARQERWTRNYLPSAAKYLRDNLHMYSAKAGKRMDACKVGVAKFDFTALADATHGAFLTLRPINHLVTEVFNRRIAYDRIDQRSEAESIWAECFAALLAGHQIFDMPSPSQLFLELSVATADGAIVIARKSETNSVYARRNGGYVRTCGVEGGPNWEQVVTPHDGARAALEFVAYARKVLRNEYKVECVDSDEIVTPGYLSCGLPKIVFHSFVLQGVHLNTAMLGHCTLPVMKGDLERHLRATVSSGGLVFDDLQFWGEADCNHALLEDEGSSLWHGTALARLRHLVRNWSSLVGASDVAA